MASLHDLDRWPVEKMPRSKLVGAPYNPRKTTAEQRKRLRGSLKKFGLVQPIVYNVQTGNVVGGHQRLTALDALSKSDDYELQVIVVDLSPKEERELNVVLNNPHAQGEYDLDKLESLFRDDGIDPLAAGFSDSEVLAMFGAEVASGNLEVLERLGEQLRELKQRDKAIAGAAKIDPDTEIGYYRVVVFRDAKAAEAFDAVAGVEAKDVPYVNGFDLMEKLHGRGEEEARPTAETH